MSVNSVIRRGNPVRQTNDKSLEQSIIKGAAQKGIPIIRENGRIHAKEASYCSRQSTFNALHNLILGEDGTVTFTASSIFYMGIGEVVHNIITTALERESKLLFAEYKLPETVLNMGGKIDAIVYDQHKIKVLEIKTCGALPKAVKPEHYAQAVAYSSLLGVDTIVLYISRNVVGYDQKLMLTTFNLYPTLDERRKVVMSLALARIAIDDHKLPPVLFETVKSCEYCQFVPYCWGADTSKVDNFEYYGQDRADLFARAAAMTDELFSDMLARRNGILKHLSGNGTDFAKTLLDGTNWEALV